MVTFSLDLVPLWTAILAVGVFLYVLLDGFDLGVGILYGLAPDTPSRNLVMNSIAPIWDGNETWLILGGVALLAAFPLAFAIIIPAVYFPVLLMLLAMVFRGVAFEFRYRDAQHRTFWDHAFCWGSGLATFAQGTVLGAFIQGFKVDGRHFVGTSMDWLTPFSILTGLALVFGYGLLGAGWLIIKTDGALQRWARIQGRRCFLAVLIAVAVVSVWTPLADPAIAARWFSWPNIRPPRPGAAAHCPGRLARVARAEQQGRGAALPRCHPALPSLLSRHRRQPVADDRAPALQLVGRRLATGHASLPDDRHAPPPAGHPPLHRLVLLGLPRQGPRRHRLSLTGYLPATFRHLVSAGSHRFLRARASAGWCQAVGTTAWTAGTPPTIAEPTAQPDRSGGRK